MASLVNSLVVLALWATVAAAQEKVQVAVYFESYCPDSVKFLTKQLFPTFNSLGNYMNVTLVPYGKATTNRSDSGVTFTCHHEEKECKGNMVIACVLQEKDVPLQDQFKFINCTSSAIAAEPKRADYPVKECASASLSAEKVLGCSTGENGSNYLEMYGKMTSEAFPNNITSVPTIVFNNRYLKEDQDAAVSDFRKALCSKISGTKPAECNKSGASGLQAAVLPLLAAIYVVSRV